MCFVVVVSACAFRSGVGSDWSKQTVESFLAGSTRCVAICVGGRGVCGGVGLVGGGVGKGVLGEVG